MSLYNYILQLYFTVNLFQLTDVQHGRGEIGRVSWHNLSRLYPAFRSFIISEPLLWIQEPSMHESHLAIEKRGSHFLYLVAHLSAAPVQTSFHLVAFQKSANNICFDTFVL